MNVCIVGYGAIGPVHAEAISSTDGVSLYGICDINREAANAAAEKYGAKAFYDFDECLKDESIDSVHICTPHYLHYEMITKSIEAGKQVVVEKPAVMKKSEYEILLSKYNTESVFPILQNRTNACITELKHIIEADADLGALKGVKGILTWKRSEEYYNSAPWRGTKLYEGGGVLINQAVHTLDLMVYFGGEAESISASTSNRSLIGIIEVEDTVDAYIKFKNGAKGIFYATNAYAENSPMYLELIFENRCFIYTHGKLFSNGEIICTDSGKFYGKDYWGSGHRRTLYDLYVKNKRLCLNDIKSTMDAMFAIYESAEKGKEIIL